LINFAKAFDVAGHTILLDKLGTLGEVGTDQFVLKWIVSFLSVVDALPSHRTMKVLSLRYKFARSRTKPV